ncbi:MAG: hypothetical protein K2P99_06980 [Burkholderiales bacterium]|nr:hypothetical protein [Burkholderiales bacterium]
MKRFLMFVWLLPFFCYANTTDNTFSGIADTFNNWVGGSLGMTALGLCLIVVIISLLGGLGMKSLFTALVVAIVIKYGAQILTSISGVSAETSTELNGCTVSNSLDTGLIITLILAGIVISLYYKNKKLKDKLKKYESDIKTKKVNDK